MEQGIIIASLILIVAAAVACAMFHSLLKSAISLAAVSVVLSIILFTSGATWAALFELSVCAGLVTAIFVSAISMTKASRHSPEQYAESRKRFLGLPFVLIFSGLVLVAIVLITGFTVHPTFDPTAAVSAPSFKDVFWNTRQADILGQIIVILAGAFAIVTLFKESENV